MIKKKTTFSNIRGIKFLGVLNLHSTRREVFMLVNKERHLLATEWHKNFNPIALYNKCLVKRKTVTC